MSLTLPLPLPHTPTPTPTLPHTPAPTPTPNQVIVDELDAAGANAAADLREGDELVSSWGGWGG